MGIIGDLQDCYCKLRDTVKGLTSQIGALETKVENIDRLVYRYAPPAEPGLNVQFWEDTAGPHLDPLGWAGPADPVSGYPAPTTAAPDYSDISNLANITDSATAGFNARYGIISGWFWLPNNVTHIRDANANTGEFGMVLLGDCCGGPLIEQPGGNHSVNTSGSDRTLLDSTPISGGWHYVYNPQSDSGAAQGLLLQYSIDNEASWLTVSQKQPTVPIVEELTIGVCDPIPEGYQLSPLTECCQPKWTTPPADEVDLSPQEITCAQANSLQNSGSIEPGREYIITDYNRGTVGPAQILTHGVTTTALAWDVAVLTTHDDSAWMARWNPDTCRIIDMFDDRGNKVRSDNGDEIERFPWGNALVTGNDFTDTGLAYSGGTVRDNVGEPTSYLQTSGGSITGTRLGGSADVRMTDGIISNSTIDQGRLLIDGSGRFEDSHIGGDSYVDTNSVEIRDSRFDALSYFYGDGGVGRVDRLTSDRGYVDVRNSANVNIDDVDLSAYGRILANGSDLIQMQYVQIHSNAYAQVTAGNELLIANSTIADGALVQATNGRLEVRSTSVRDIARIQHSSTGTNRVDNSTLDSYGRAFFNNTADGNSINYTKIESLGMVRFRGTSTGNQSQRNSVSAQGYIDYVNETDSRVWYTTVDTISYIILNGGTGVFVYYCTFDGYGRMLIQSGSTGRVLGVNAEGTAYIRLTNHANDLRYSSFDSYFYYYLTNNTAPKQGLQGSGRQTYTEPAPGATVTGAGVRNW